MWAAIRYRRAQALALLLLSALITACAVFAPLYERLLEESLVRDGLTRQGVLTTAVVGESVTNGVVPAQPDKIHTTFPASLVPYYDSGSDLWSGRVSLAGVTGIPSSITVVGPQDTCRSLQVVEGACPTKPFEVAVSAAEATVQGWRIGAQLQPTEETPISLSPSEAFPAPFVVTGFFRQQEDPGHWFGFSLEGRAGQVGPSPSDTPLMDGWVTPSSTFAKGWRASRVSVLWLLQPDKVSLDGLAVISSGVASMEQAALASNGTIRVDSGVPDLVDSVLEGQRQARTIVPLLIGQLAVLAVVVLGLVAAAAVEQRRPELALGRLRGRGPSGAAAMVLRELGVVVAAGVPVGFALALGLGEVARRFWLAEGVPFEVPGTTVVAALVALAVAVLAVVIVARPTLREPISTLLRRVPPRRQGWAVGVVDAVVIAVAVAGLVTLASGNLSGPLALATPTLLALALGLVLAHVLVPLADLAARRLTRRGRVVGALTAVQVARRPAVRRIMAIITVATALTVFATDALVVGARNRDERARVETGAEAVLTTNASDAKALVAAVATADPTGTVATPVVRVRQGSATAMRTLAVVPDQFARIAQLPRDPSAFPWNQLDGRPPAGIVLTGRRLSVTLDGASVVAASPEALAQGGTGNLPPPTLVAYLAPTGSQAFTVSMGELPTRSAAPVTLARDVACPVGCQLAGFAIATPAGSSETLRGSVTISDVTMDASAAAPIGNAADWLPFGHPEAPPEQLQAYAKAVDAGGPTRLTLAYQSRLEDVRITPRSSVAALPALVAGSLPNGSPGPAFQAAGLDGISLDFVRSAPIPYAPGGGTDEAIVSLTALIDKSSSVAALAQAQVWVGDAAAVPGVRSALTRAGIAVSSVATRAELQELYDSSASAWGLRLALVVGILALLIAAIVLVLVAVTTWRGRARDYAALRMAGVTAAALRRVALGEQWTVVAVSVVVGAAAGVLGAQLAMPIIPFFTAPSAAFPVDTAPAVPQTAAAAAAALLALLLVGWVVGVRLVARASLSRVREPL